MGLSKIWEISRRDERLPVYRWLFIISNWQICDKKNHCICFHFEGRCKLINMWIPNSFCLLFISCIIWIVFRSDEWLIHLITNITKNIYITQTFVLTYIQFPSPNTFLQTKYPILLVQTKTPSTDVTTLRMLLQTAYWHSKPYNSKSIFLLCSVFHSNWQPFPYEYMIHRNSTGLAWLTFRTYGSFNYYW